MLFNQEALKALKFCDVFFITVVITFVGKTNMAAIHNFIEATFSPGLCDFSSIGIKMLYNFWDLCFFLLSLDCQPLCFTTMGIQFFDFDITENKTLSLA